MKTTHTPGPWKWTSDNAGPDDEYGCPTVVEIDPHKFKSTGYASNPVLIGANGLHVIHAGCGEYTPYDNTSDAVLIAAAPELLAALEVCVKQCADYENMTEECAAAFRNARSAIAKAKGLP